MDYQEIEAVISNALPPFEWADVSAANPYIDDATATEVSRILRSSSDEDGSVRPRTYILLHYLCLTRYHTAFAGHTDDHLPYLDWTLPDKLDEEARQYFLMWQDLVMPKEGEPLGPTAKPHMTFKNDHDCRLSPIRVLGHGAWGVVECVQGMTSGKIFARKTFFFRGRRPEVRLRQASFERELKVLKRLNHRHLITYVGSYTGPNGASLMMLPVAECDLSTWMQESSDTTIIHQFFGCLASALAFLHQEKVRHKDIKPSNILVYKSRVLLSDFGSSLDWKELDMSTTSGNAEAGTRIYAAPEAFDYERRSSSSDIFSLGCVFLELATILCGRLHDDLSRHLKENGTCVAPYGDNEGGIRSWIEELKKIQLTTPELGLLGIILHTLATDRRKHPTAEKLTNDIMDLGEEFSCSHRRVDMAMNALKAMKILVQTSNQKIHALCKAAREGDITLFQYLLDVMDDSDIQAHSDNKKSTVLVYAIRFNHLSIAERYLSYCQRRSLDPDTRLALHVSVELSCINGVDLLLNSGADPNATCPDLRSPLYTAAYLGHEQIVRRMINRGTNLDCKDPRDGRTTLHAAVRHPSDTGVLELILAQRPDVDCADDEGSTPIMEATKRTSPRFLDLLLKAGANPNIANKAGLFPVNRLYEKRREKMLQLLISAGAHPHLEGHHGSYGAFFLASRGYASMLQEALIALKRRNVFRDHHHRNLLHVATRAQSECTIRMLLTLEQPSLIATQSQDDKGRTPLHYAAARTSISILEILLSPQDVPAMTQDFEGYTPLFSAVRNGNSLKSVDLLISKDRRAVNIRNIFGETPLGHACTTDNLHAIAAVLIKNGANIHYAARTTGNTPLHIAAIHGSTDIVRLLLENGVDIEARNFAKQTPVI